MHHPQEESNSEQPDSPPQSNQAEHKAPESNTDENQITI